MDITPLKQSRCVSRQGSSGMNTNPIPCRMSCNTGVSIMCVLKADVSMFDFQQTSFHSPQELEAYAAQAKALSLFETGVAGAGCETTLTLVTCSYEWKEARNILVAVKAEPER